MCRAVSKYFASARIRTITWNSFLRVVAAHVSTTASR